MSSIKRFPAERLDALKRGRAIPFLIDHRGSDCPGYTLSVIATIDDGTFVGVFLADDEPESELVRLPLPEPMLPEPFALTSDAADAHAIHRLWHRWDAGLRDTYLDLFSVVGILNERVRLDDVLASHPPPPAPEAPTPKRRAKANKPSKRGAKPRNKRGPRP